MGEPVLNFAHICDYAFNGEGNKPCIIGIFQNITILNSEQPHPQMFIVTNIKVETGKEYKQEIKLIKEDKPNENIIDPITITIKVPRESGQEYVDLGFIGQINNIKFKVSGKYLFKIYIDSTFLDEIPIMVTVNNS